jgi:oxalate decarboxylase/phosphoglucose isomerase-like protein (cupin superfamily)
MRLAPGEDIGREAHPHLDQFLRIESGTGRVEFGQREDDVEETHDVRDDWAIVVPAGVWHNVVNTCDGDLKLYSLYAPPEHTPTEPSTARRRTPPSTAESGVAQTILVTSSPSSTLSFTVTTSPGVPALTGSPFTSRSTAPALPSVSSKVSCAR